MPGYKWIRGRVNSQRYFSLSKGVPRKPSEGQSPDAKHLELKERPKATDTFNKGDRAVLGRGGERFVPMDVEAQVEAKHLEYPTTASLKPPPSKFDESFDLPIQKPLDTERQLSDDRQSSEATIVASLNTSNAHGASPVPPETVATAKGGPAPGLDVDLQPKFEEHRSVWVRMLDAVSSRSSWKKGTLGTSGSKSRP